MTTFTPTAYDLEYGPFTVVRRHIDAQRNVTRTPIVEIAANTIEEAKQLGRKFASEYWDAGIDKLPRDEQVEYFVVRRGAEEGPTWVCVHNYPSD